jgi:Zn-dependent peptidase ImmA (M78 family)
MYPGEIARNLLNRYGNHIPVDPHFIAEKLGIQVRYVPFAFDPDPEKRNLSGIAYQKGGIKYIEVNAGDHQVRQRFTLAHELGHHLLGHTDNGVWFRDTPNDFAESYYKPNEEVQANAFAADLLMPKDYLDYLMSNGVVDTLADLAKEFNVSVAAIEIRLRKLGYI